METTNPTRQMKQQCCREMRDVTESCRCEAVNMMMQDMMQREEYQGQDMQEMMRTAKRLPSMCNMKPQYCEIRRTSETEIESGQQSERCQREMQGMRMNMCQ
ncbi:2S sulfur-rich seed storage protein 1-like [Papaver somniferum]|uniref:2S sulfur-rich seed storage protein 1-like n=1 Tax=Papaver somniferum TaxID=3469 RepID=UPI000E6F54AD|nr:2S sulfur-rich seed storage protein 1-like [Papaver somniferum]